MSRLDDYLTEISTQLQLGAEASQGLLLEVRSHLEDSARALQLGGLSKKESEVKAMEKFGDARKIGKELKQVHGGATRQDAWLTALPPAIFGLSTTILFLLAVPWGRLVIGLPTRVRYGPGINAALALGIGVLLLATLTLAAGGVVAAARRLPVWGHSWTGAAAVAILFVLMLASGDRACLVSPAVDELILIALLLLIGAALGAAGWRGPLLGGLAGLSTTMILSLVVVFWASAAPFSRLDVALLAGPLGLVYGGLLYGFVTGPPAPRAALLAVGGLLCLATMMGVEYGVLWQGQLNHGQAGQIWTLLAVGVALLAFGPVVGLVAQRLRPQVA